MDDDVAADAAAALAAVRAGAAATRDGLRADLDALAAATAGANTDDEHDPEGATIAWERQQAAAALDRARARIAAVDAAVERLAAGTYGTCATCGHPIAAERLAARPEVATCVRCAS